MKKIVSMLIMLLVCFCFSSAAYAAGECFTVKYVDVDDKLYVVDSTEVPQFDEPVPDANNPVSDGVNITLGTPDTVNRSEFTIPISLPIYTEPGEYKYSITQKSGSEAGVAYDIGPIVFRVLVGYNDAGNVAVLDTGVGFSGENKKTDFTNVFCYGSLTITNTVSGTVEDRGKEFEIKVTFTDPVGENVPEVINYTIVNTNGTTSFGESRIGNSQEKTVTLFLTHGSTATFNNIPAGISYTVVRDTMEGFNDPVITPGPGSITAGQAASATVNNSAIVSINSGVLFQHTGALIILAVAVVGLLLLLIRKKRI